ncbi:hypothetical protein jhhlp_004740 [Lomentospora prolificans]|uniref:Protoheme IX farnesyltransferase, mitochondrial n=1 Tax=Lomentospora prolificans TaxID=41688 RepID=A0A2N3N8H3_9PEZI|nr:hypothetical protein jhhlp_004740 [Lomentospora prolificans]
MLRPVTAAPSLRSIPIRRVLQPLARSQCDNFHAFSPLPKGGPTTFVRRLRFVSTTPLRTAPTASARLTPEFFFSSPPSSSRAKHGSAQHAVPSDSVASSDSGKELPPHRRRQAAKRAAAAAAATAAASTSGPAIESSISHPPDASAVLAHHAAQQPANSFRRSFSSYLSLSKPRLTVLVVLTAMVPYALYPVPAFLSPTLAAETPSLSPLTLLFLTTGTALCSAAANSLNMLYEPATDALMSRTRNRPLVRRLVSKPGAFLFAVITALTGTAALYFGVNPTVSFLGATNIVLYAGIYTPLKALHPINTWVGALVGGIPPLMGWAAAAGESATGDGSWRELLFASDGSSIGGWLFASLLFAWQFPHFMGLSWPIREEYRAAGLRMLAWTNPARNARVALRYSLVFAPICFALCAAGVTEWSFAATSLPVNAWLVWQAVHFWRFEGHKGSARGLFWASVWHLPAILVLALMQKKGMWMRVWRSVMGGEAELDEEGFYLDDEVVEITAEEKAAAAVRESRKA